MTQPLIDFVIPSYRDSRILRAIRSIRRHSDNQKFRIIIQDGGSNAELISLIYSELATSDLLLQEEDAGIFDALNKGLRQASSPWIGWIGADDLLAQTFDVTELEKTPNEYAIVAYTTKFFSDATKRVTRTFTPVRSSRLRRMGLHLPHFSTFVRREAALSTKFYVDQKNFADIAYFSALEKKYMTRVVGSVSTYMAEGGSSNSSARLILRTNISVLKIVKQELGLPRALTFVILKLSYKVLQKLLAKLKPQQIPRSLW